MDRSEGGGGGDDKLRGRRTVMVVHTGSHYAMEGAIESSHGRSN